MGRAIRRSSLFHSVSLSSTQQVVAHANDHYFESVLSVDGIFEEIEQEAALFQKTTYQPADNIAASVNNGYGSPKSRAAVDRAMATGVPQKTRGQTKWSVRTWSKWAVHRNNNLLPSETQFNCSIEVLSVNELAFWLSRYVLEVRREDGKCYPPNSLYQLCCGLLRHLNDCGRPEVNMFQQAEFQKVLDAEMKRLNSTGMYIAKKQAQPISVEMEDRLWELQLLGSSSPSVMLNTLVYMVGLYFSLRSGSEHRRLRFSPSQIEPLSKPKDIWFSKTPCGHNTLQNVVPGLMKKAGFKGYFTNHSLRATRLFNAGIDEQLIMSRTGHSSTEGVRAYKRSTMQLCELTSDVLNQLPSTMKNVYS